MKTIVKCFALALLVATAGSAVGAVSGKPNIVFILADDLGYGDLGSYNPHANGDAPNNTPIRTPNLERMAGNGARLTDFHAAAPICSPSRRALLTARYPNRLGEWAEGYRERPEGVSAAKDPTLGMWLKQAGYATACYGKWNIGSVKGVSWPGAHGFDDWLIIDHNTGYFQHQNDNAVCQGREMLFGTDGERVTSLRGKHLTDIFTDKALGFIEANQANPFFLYLPFAVPHNPLQDPADALLDYKDGPKAGTPEGRAVFVKMVEYLDSRIGKIFQALEKNGLMDHTLIVFTSDNGGQKAGNCWPLKKWKTWLEEGGTRVPCLMQWPGVIPAGSVCDQPSIMMDASVTLLAVSGALEKVPAGRTLDGMDLLPVLQRKTASRSRTFGWRSRDWNEKRGENYLRQEVCRQGDWKLLRTYKHRDGIRLAQHTDELFNLADDIGEKNNHAADMPEKLVEMQQRFTQWKNTTVNLDSDFLIPALDQTGSPSNEKLKVYVQNAPNPKGKKYVPNPLSGAEHLMLFDFAEDQLQGKLMTRGNEDRVSVPVIKDGIFKIEIQPGCVRPIPMIFREGSIDTGRFSKLIFRMRVSSAGRCESCTALAMLRFNIWKGKDIPFAVQVDGQWHDYPVDASLSPAWAEWTSHGRIGLVFPASADHSLTIELDTIELTK